MMAVFLFSQASRKSSLSAIRSNDLRLVLVLELVLQRCRDCNLKLKESKCNFRQSELKYLGHVIGDGTIRADVRKVEAITKMPKPECKDDVSRLLGMATYLAKFCPNLSEVTTPLRELTKKGVEWSWSEAAEQAFEKLKFLVSSSPTLKMFDPELPVTLSVDASQFGMGAVIMHAGQPIEYASCSLTETQRKYAQIEKEYLAIQYGLRRFHQYIYGQHVMIETDHLPLIGIMKKGLNELSPRLMRMRLRNQGYDYTLIHKPGRDLILADTLSHAFLPSYGAEANKLEALDHDQIDSITTGIITQPLFKEKLSQATKLDPTMQILASYIKHGWPMTKHACLEPLKPYWNVKSDLTMHNDLLLCRAQIVIPIAMRKTVLDQIHAGHMGVSKCTERAKGAVYWPGYLGQIRDLIESCSVCQEYMRSNSQYSLEPYDIPEYPMQSVSMDIFHLDGNDYLVTVDRYSKWPACYQLKTSRSLEVIDLLKRQFIDFGRPETLVSDNASYFTSYEFKCFIEDNDVKHITSSPYHSRSNGLAERMNQTIKNSLRKALISGQTLCDVLATLRSTPLGDQLPSPAVLLQARNLRGQLHCLPHQLKPQGLHLGEIHSRFVKRQSQAIFQNNTATLPTEYCVGMKVWCKLGHRKWAEGVIVEHAETPRSYYIKLSDGKVFRRNIKSLRPNRSSHAYNKTSINDHIDKQQRLVESTNSDRTLINDNLDKQQKLVESTNSDKTLVPVQSAQQSQLAVVPNSVDQSGTATPASTGATNPNQMSSSFSSVVTRSGRVSKPPTRLGFS